MSAPGLEALGLSFAYRPGAPVLAGLDLAARPGRLRFRLGRNGSGKTTLLRCLLGRLAPSGGQIRLMGIPLSGRRPRERARLLAYVPQQPQSAFAFTVRELVLMGRHAHTGALGLAGPADLEAAERALEAAGLSRLAERTLEELSGGEAQCAMIARALAQEPRVLLLDEPASHLDLAHQVRVHRLLRELAAERGVALVCVSHDINLAARFADELCFLQGGRVAASGAPADVLRKELLEAVFGVRVRLVECPGRSVPLVGAE